MQATQEKALQTFGSNMDPIVRQVFVQRSCSVLLNENSLLYPAPNMDITPQVVQGLNAKIQSFPFDREHLDQAAPPAVARSPLTRLENKISASFSNGALMAIYVEPAGDLT